MENNQLEATLRKEGFRIVQTWQILLLIIGMILSIGVIYGVSQTRLQQTELKVDKLETWKDDYIKENQRYQMKLLDELYEIKSDLRLIKEKQGIK